MIASRNAKTLLLSTGTGDKGSDDRPTPKLPHDRLTADASRELCALKEILARAEQRSPGQIILVTRHSEAIRTYLLEAMAMEAILLDLSVALASTGPNRDGLETLMGAMCAGTAPVLTAHSVHVITALKGRSSIQTSLLEGLMRQHSRWRPIVLLVDKVDQADEKCRHLLNELPRLLRNERITWVYASAEPDFRLLSPDLYSPLPPIPKSAVGRSTEATVRVLSPEPFGAERETPPPTLRATRPKFGWAALTETEQRVASLIADGHTNRSAAAALSVSPNTVATHVRSLFTKLDVNSRVQLTRIVIHRESDGSHG